MYAASSWKMRYVPVLLALAPSFVVAQFPTCDSGFGWTFNSQGQSPCEVASGLGEACTGVSFPIPTLTTDENYLGPNPSVANDCRCSSVFYSVLSACALCQNAVIAPWTYYNQNCSTVTLTVFRPPIPAGTPVPHYAYLDPTLNGANIFNPALAQADVGPDSSAIPQPTGATTLPGTTSNPGASSNHTGKSKSNAGAIAGGVVGGVVAIAAIVGLIFFLRRRRRRTQTQAPAAPFHPQNFISEKPIENSNTGNSAPGYGPGRLYDPNDPSTFPGNAESFVPSLYSSPAGQSQQFPQNPMTVNHTGATNYTPGGFVGSQSNLPHHQPQTGYAGTAEVM